MSAGEQVLKSKLLPPRLRRHTLVRPRLQERLLEALDVPLTIVQAGPGYGKTTALVSFLGAAPCRWGWYAVSAEDQHPLPFLLHLIHAVNAAVPGLGERAAALLQSAAGPHRPWTQVVDALTADLHGHAGQELLVVLDDFHHVDENPQIVALVEQFIEHMPHHVHLALATRRRPPLSGLPRWRALADVVELSEKDLAFTPAEVEELFLDQYGIRLTGEQTAALAARTEGWIIALQLAWQGLRKGSSLQDFWEGQPKNLDTLFDYLAHEVLDRQRPFIRRFLLTTCVLERLQPRACDHLTGEGDSERVLAALEESGLFTQAVGDGEFRYHQLFHQFLREQARQDPESWRTHHLAAARYYLAAGSAETAAHHFAEVGEFDQAADAILQAADGMIEAGRVEALGAFLARLPQETYSRFPALLLRCGDVARLTSRFDEALAYYGQAAEKYAVLGDDRGRCLALMGEARVYLDTISPGKADDALVEAQRLAHALTDRERADLMALLAENETNRGRPENAARFASMAAASTGAPVDDLLEVRSLLRTGRLAEAMRILERLARQGLAGASRAHREVPLLISYIAALMGDTRLTRTGAEEGIRLGKEKRSPFVEGVGLMRRAHALQLDPHAPDEAVAAEYQAAIALMDEINVTRGKAEPLAGLALFYGHRAGNWAQAEHYGLESARIARAACDQWFHGYALLSLGSSAAALGRTEAAGYLREAEKEFAATGDPYGLALARVWQALLAHRQRDWAGFAASMESALAAAQEHGYGYLFTRRTLFGPQDPQALVPLLQEARRRGIHPAYATRLLAEIGMTDPEHHPGYTLRLRTLGAFQAWRGRQEITRREWRREKARQLLQLFITHRGRLLQREQILDLLWPDADPETAQRDFRVALNTLLSALEPDRPARADSFYIVREGLAYGLNPHSGYWLDADEFKRLAAEGLALAERRQEDQARDTLSQAVELYQGEFLAELRYEDWCSEERERLQVLYLRALEWLAQDAARHGGYEQCVRLCERILACDPCWEEAYRLLMHSHFRLGNRAMALRTYEKCVQSLRRELGVGPMASTTRLYERIRRSAAHAPEGGDP
ncbi:BTAD domain-containing putative transcriptional regulator [Symbiobacterium thermophilum]|uniref:BTAD domain-containing putative transcriptional regulator n=1 Tax=Symbiobacterium thermophilum TaxID=2734 RepID=UPI0035C67AB7